MPDQIDALVTFYESWRQEGVGADGLPLFAQVAMVRMAKPPLLQIEREAYDADQAMFPDEWRAFEKMRAARDTTIKGYPLSLWPVISPADFKMLSARDIVTVEQLAPLADRPDVIPPIRELAHRARRLLAVQGKTGKYEEIITDLTQQRDALSETLREANATLSAQSAMIDMLKGSAPVRQVA